ncbi:hypothetical protein CNECB9_1100006 [Cupriavidus necator]|uniref:Uncharacterized protein n=1 Tax=Cupriavidus necator TaxID=106590 RepID=A0A1K0I9B7_CUPNE|nr:hypothetical protein CNECB9_1100006 [Cupriavidus necator]
MAAAPPVVALDTGILVKLTHSIAINALLFRAAPAVVAVFI